MLHCVNIHEKSVKQLIINNVGWDGCVSPTEASCSAAVKASHPLNRAAYNRIPSVRQCDLSYLFLWKAFTSLGSQGESSFSSLISVMWRSFTDSFFKYHRPFFWRRHTHTHTQPHTHKHTHSYSDFPATRYEHNKFPSWKCGVTWRPSVRRTEGPIQK